MFGGPDVYPNAQIWTTPLEQCNETVDYYDLGSDDNYSQPRVFWKKVLDADAKQRLVENIASTLKFANKTIQERTTDQFSKVDEDLGNRIRKRLQTENKMVYL